ncbi:MAG: hypothetical protein CVU24_12480 [Betaproteobacteria bacterium HGW-Betaproteobacteria-18]|nr:MAG: hypothetical protein CVU24_12480 [Betaproteobacteria bacterium HGW-Betaproteobacteria-18]
MVITGTRMISGVSAWVFNESNPVGDGIAVESYYTKDDRAFTYLGSKFPSGWLDSLVNSFDLMRFDGTFSASPLLNKTNVDMGVDLDGDGINERVDVQVNGAVEGYETLVTNLGSFSNTARLRYDITGTVRASTGPTATFTEILHEWRAPEVGSLRQVISMSADGTTQYETLEARGLSVNGVVAGVLAPKELLGALASADSDTTRPGAPGLASDGTHYLLVSNRLTASGRQWIGQFVGADGQAQDNFEISPVSDLWGSPSVAWNGSSYLVITGGENAFGMYAQRVSATGLVLDAYPGTNLAPDGYNRALAAAGDKWLAVYGRTSSPGTLFGRFISSSGAADAEFTIATGYAGYEAPAVAFNGENFVVVWETSVTSGDPSSTNLHAIRISPQGMSVDAAPFAISTAPEAQLWPQIACDPTNCLVTWVDRRNYPGASYNFSPGPGDMYGAFVTRAGTVLNGPPATGGIPIATGVTANAGYPGLAFTGSEYVAAWSRGAFVNNPGGPTGIYAVRISTDGTAITSAPGIAVSWTPEWATRYVYPTLAASSSGVLAVWLKNTEQGGTSKSIAGTVIWPKVTR